MLSDDGTGAKSFASRLQDLQTVGGSEEHTDEFALSVRSTDEELARPEPFLGLGGFAPNDQEAWTKKQARAALIF